MFSLATQVLEIVQDAIKIGLGALIGGGFSLLVARNSFRSSLTEGLIKDRRVRLYDIAREFIEIEGRIVRYYIDTRVFKNIELTENDEIDLSTFEETKNTLISQSDATHTEDLMSLRSMAMGLEVIGAAVAAEKVRQFLSMAENGTGVQFDASTTLVRTHAELSKEVVDAIEASYASSRG